MPRFADVEGKMNRLESQKDLERHREQLKKQRDPQRPLISLCAGSGCGAYGTDEVKDALEREISQNGLKERVEIKVTGCHGFCEKGPVMVIHPEGTFYSQVKVADVPEIVAETLVNKQLVDRLLYKDPVSKQKVSKESEVPFYSHQHRLIFGNNGLIDPTNIDDYIAMEGYSALAEALFSMSPEEIIETIKESGLRGRGGGGFPTGIKWASCRKAHGEPRYVMCNADEGDPGAYMDRSLLEGNPHSVLEGMVIGAYAIGSNEGFIYVRNEYPLAVKNIDIAIKQAEDYGLLGEDILDSGFDFKVKISRGGGAFVCGESSALPRAKYIHTVEKGYRDLPSTLNNVETWANVPLIINKGADYYASIGTEKSKGTKIFSLVGKVKNTGLVEVPMGTSLRTIIYDIGGGILKNKKFKAVQTGGPSGGCVPEGLLDLPVDFEKLTQAGAMMGSGGMIVMDQDNCMVDVARYFLDFLQEESCGQCVPCREGVTRLLQVLTDICAGEGKDGDIELLENVADTLHELSLCALGGTAANPILTTLLYFRDEYLEHIHEKKCRAGVCKGLFYYEIDEEKCNGCHVCFRKCPQEAVYGEKKEPHTIDQEKCIHCTICYESCKFEAIVIK
jgi:NADH-quinone oxidoreductase subunit F